MFIYLKLWITFRISDEEYKNMGVKFSDDEKEIINLSNIIVQLGTIV